MTHDTKLGALLEPLRTALQMEVEGKQLFIEAARRATGRHARQTFEFLAAEEDKHIAHIRKFFASIQESAGKTPPQLDPSDAPARLRAFNDRIARMRDELRPTKSDVEAYRFAIRFENGAEDFYRKQIEETDNEHVRAFYAWLVEEETLHAGVLQSCLDFAEDPAAWFKTREQ
jgi:rubrerythrin